MKYFFVLTLILLIFCLSINQSNGQSGGNGAGSSGNSGTNSGKTGTNNGDGSQGFNQGYSYNTGIRPYQTGFTYYQPFGDAANNQNNAGAQDTGAKTGGTQSAQPVTQPVTQPVAQPVAPVGYQPGYNVFSTPQSGNNVPQSGQPVQYQNVPQFIAFGQPPPQGAQVQPIPIQPIPIQLPNFDGGNLPNLNAFGLGGTPQRNNRQNNANNNIPNLGNDFSSGDFDIPVLGGGGGGGGGNNNNNNNNGFFSQPNNNNNNDFGFPSASNGGGFFPSSNVNQNNGYDSLPDDSSLANFANLGGGQSNDYPDNDNDFGNLGGFGSATQNRGTLDLPGFNTNGFFRRK